MRHQAAATARQTTVWEDLGLGVAAFALCLALTMGLGLWLSYVTGALFTLGVAILAWRHGFRPALVTAILATAAIGPLTAALDVRADAVSLTVRVVSVGVVSLAIAWLCGNLYRSREQLLVEQSRLRESEGFHRL
ncbi:MAG: hypothetical protein Q8L75_13890, partial [Acidobacteriota bacterium]|nr:hypothetical protein [Acidobacteriota bacterium]